MDYLVYINVFFAGFAIAMAILPSSSHTSSSHKSVEQYYNLLYEHIDNIKKSVSSIRGMIQEDRMQRIKDCEEQMIQLASLSGVQEQLDHRIRKIEELALGELTRLNAENMELKSNQLRLRNQLDLTDKMLLRQRRPNGGQNKNDPSVSNGKNCEGSAR